EITLQWRSYIGGHVASAPLPTLPRSPRIATLDETWWYLEVLCGIRGSSSNVPMEVTGYPFAFAATV
ncbi:MAG: hypothetical protein Q8R24_08655, partial [Legionellaceae bacterium]|nr:hypothetical protein [Legionellaceae bacterium]